MVAPIYATPAPPLLLPSHPLPSSNLHAAAVHISNDPRVELIIGNTIFADGAAAVIVTGAGFSGAGRPALSPTAADAQWAIGDMASDIVPDSAHCMSWKTSPITPGQYDMWLDRRGGWWQGTG